MNTEIFDNSIKKINKLQLLPVEDQYPILVQLCGIMGISVPALSIPKVDIPTLDIPNVPITDLALNKRINSAFNNWNNAVQKMNMSYDQANSILSTELSSAIILYIESTLMSPLTTVQSVTSTGVALGNITSLNKIEKNPV